MHRARIGDEGAALNRIGPNIALAMAAALFATMVLTHLSYPLIWEDESDSVMFGQRILRFGYPKVHDEKNTLYGLKDKLEIGVDPETDAYTGAPWVNYYVGAIGVALAEQVDDVYEKTFRVRLPYTLIGFAGLILLFVAVAPAMGASRGAKQRAAFTYLLMLCVSISLILHLREARYYPIVLLQYGALVYAFVRHHFYQQLSFGRYVAISFVSLFLLFNTFYPAFGVWCIATSIFLGLRALQRNEPFASKVASLLRTNAPVFIATATVLPLLLYFDFAVQADRWFDQFGSSVAAYGYNLWIVLFNMLRFEFLVPALVLKAALVVLRFSHPTSRTDLRAEVSTSTSFTNACVGSAVRSKSSACDPALLSLSFLLPPCFSFAHPKSRGASMKCVISTRAPSTTSFRISWRSMNILKISSWQPTTPSRYRCSTSAVT
jgi:hypothetical protein